MPVENLLADSLPTPLNAEVLSQAANELSFGGQIALESCVGAWKVTLHHDL